VQFDGRVVLVTGASRGIGRAIALAFAAEGASVAVNYLRDKAAADEVVAECARRGGHALAVQADVTDADSASALVAAVAESFGRIDALVNNAVRAYQFDPEARSSFLQTDWDAYQSQFEGSVGAAYVLCREVVPHMQRLANGAIVNITTDLVERPVVPYHDYTTAKAALVGFSRNLAADVGQYGIRVNCVAPGLVAPTAASRTTKESVKQKILAQTPLRRIATPADIAGPVVFLASDAAQFVTGQMLFVDGGLVMR
jgi:3-oxoacyl-[acyl-carrier protein] reductase